MTETPIVIEAYNATDVVVSEGVAIGDPITFANELVLDDVYQLAEGGRTAPLALQGRSVQGVFSRVDRPDRSVHLDCCVTLMTGNGVILEALILVEVADDIAEAVYLLPLAPLDPLVNYRLVSVARHTVMKRFAQICCGSFAAGTRIAMHDGQLCPIDALCLGDLILTRDNGPQPLRWIGKSTLRASGCFAPVVIRAGALNNDADLVVRADHRLFVSQRSDGLNAGKTEGLIRARHLINGDTVYQCEGGFVDYYQLVLDAHHVIYAEGIAAETQHLCAMTRPSLSDDPALSDHAPTRLPDYDVKSELILPEPTPDLLRQASSR